MIFRVKHMTAEAIPHVYCRVFVSPAAGQTFAGVGSLTMRKAEFEEFRKGFKAEFVEEDYNKADTSA